MSINIDQVRDHLRRGGARPELIASVATALMTMTRASEEQALSEMVIWRNLHQDAITALDDRQIATPTEIEDAQKRTGITL